MVQPAPIDKRVIFILVFIKLLIPFLLIAPEFELQRDEYLYYQQGQHLDLGYLENPPMLAYFANISSWFGGGEWAVKIWPALFGALTLNVTCLIAARLGGGSFAQLLAGFGMVTGAFLRIHILFQPNILDIFFWTCSLYFLLCFIQSNNTKDFYWLLICLVLGWWSKYSIAFIAVSIIIGLLLTRHRTIFIQRKTYVALLIAFLFIIPNIIWQHMHKWPLLHHMQELRETQLVYVKPMDFIKDQLLLLLPLLLVWIAGLWWFFRNSAYRVFGWIYLIVIILLIAGSGKSYYSLGVYPVLLAAGAVAWEKWSASIRWLRKAVAILVIALTLPFVPVALPMLSPEILSDFYGVSGIAKTGLLKWEDQRDHELPQDFADMLGWKELTERTERFYQSLPDSTKAVAIIYCRNYGQAGSLKFYGKDGSFKSKVISDNGSFLLWIPDSMFFRHLIFTGRRMPGNDDEVFQHFEKITIIDSVRNRLSRQFGDKIIFFENGSDTAWRLAQKGLMEMKNEFKR
jgi:4-amino-4-deoxy-L-arabinose transferase-like glycosyltransferase